MDANDGIIGKLSKNIRKYLYVNRILIKKYNKRFIFTPNNNS